VDPSVFQKSIRGLLMTCGTRTIDGIVKGILDRQQPDSSAQKRNADSTIRQKKHDHPLIGGRPESPLLAKQSTYRKEYNESDHSVSITIGQKRADVGVYVQRKGYLFFGFTGYAVQQMDKLVRQYCAKWARNITLNRSENGPAQ
jgi:hypothetical protein